MKKKYVAHNNVYLSNVAQSSQKVGPPDINDYLSEFIMTDFDYCFETKYQ